MKFVFVSYVKSAGFKDPETWLQRINFYTGVLEALATRHTVISIEQISYSGQYHQNGVHYYFRQHSALGRKLPFKLHRFIKKQRPDVVVVQGLHFPLQVIQLRALLGAKPCIMLQNHAERPFNGFKKYWQALAGKYVNAYLFASGPMGMEWVERGNLKYPHKIHEVMEVSSVFKPVDKTLALSKTGATGAPVFLWIGRLNDNKDPLTVVTAFLKFAVAQPSARLYMIYHTDELLPQIKQLLVAAGKNPPIILIGRLAHDNLLYWLNSADFILSGSHYEGSGTAVCEAMSCGCIPVVTNIPSFRMITHNGECGLFYEAGNEQALLAALQQALKADRAALKTKVLAHYHSSLSFAAIAGRFNEIAEGLLV